MSPRLSALLLIRALAAMALAGPLLPAGAQEPAAPVVAGEPAVRHVVIEDEGSKVDELKVRGEVKRITVTPKVGPRIPYEVLPADGSRDLSQSGARGSAGQRVWQVLSF